MKKDTPAQALINVINTNGGGLLKDVQIFDVYEGEQIASGMKSVAVKLTFQAEDRNYGFFGKKSWKTYADLV